MPLARYVSALFILDDYAKLTMLQGWLTSTVDADTIFTNLLEGCFKAGPTVCALARPDDTTAANISRRFWTWLERLDEAPVAGVGPSGSSVILTGADMRALIAMASYNCRITPL
jgi:hypothetical protein